MEEARHYCQQRHGDLASINSKDENVFLWKQVDTFGMAHANVSHIERRFTNSVCVFSDIQKLWVILCWFVSGA